MPKYREERSRRLNVNEVIMEEEACDTNTTPLLQPADAGEFSQTSRRGQGSVVLLGADESVDSAMNRVNTDFGQVYEGSGRLGSSVSPKKLLSLDTQRDLSRRTFTRSELSNRASLSSTFNSFLGFCTKTKSRYRRMEFSAVGIASNISKSIDSDSQLNTIVLESYPTTPTIQEADVVQKVKAMGVGVEGVDKTEIAPSSATVRVRSRGGKGTPDKSSTKEPPLDRSSIYKSYPYCYIMTRDNYHSYKAHPSNTAFSHLAEMTSSILSYRYAKRSLKSMSHTKGNVAAHVSNVKKFPAFSLLNVQRHSEYRQCSRRNSVVLTVVNRGSANVSILKVANSCRNYLDINPDFGWRRLVNAEESPIPPTPNPHPTDAHKSYMYYRETKKLSYSIGLCELAINIACRASILAVTYGFINYSDLPKYLKIYIENGNASGSSSNSRSSSVTEYIKSQIRSYTIGKSSKTKMLDEKCLNKKRDTLYLKSSFLGIFVLSSIRSNIGSEQYREVFKRENNRFVWAMPEEEADGMGSNQLPQMVPQTGGNLQQQQQMLPQTGQQRSTTAPAVTPNWSTTDQQVGQQAGQQQQQSGEIYKMLPIPDYGWRLVEYSEYDQNYHKMGGQEEEAVGGKSRFLNFFRKMRRGKRQIVPNDLLCRIRAPHAGSQVWVDAGSMGMNVSEQLYRLEESFGYKEKLPKQSFGFGFGGEVISPDGQKFSLIAEELIVNTATLVHQMFITQTCILL